MIDDGQETLHVLKTIGDVTTTTTVAVGELCTRGAADDDVYVVREVRERQPADIHRLRLMGVVLEVGLVRRSPFRSEEHTSELQSLLRISYAVFCFTKKIYINMSHFCSCI